MSAKNSKVNPQIRYIADRIKKRRLRDTELTQEQVAEEIGIHSVTYSRIENAHAEMKISHAIALARLYEISLDELIGFDKDEPALTSHSRVMEPTEKYMAKARPANIIFQIGDGINSPEQERFLARLGKLLRDTFPDELED